MGCPVGASLLLQSLTELHPSDRLRCAVLKQTTTSGQADEQCPLRIADTQLHAEGARTAYRNSPELMGKGGGSCRAGLGARSKPENTV
eukprot:2417965-Rhodomonas_salina.2